MLSLSALALCFLTASQSSYAQKWTPYQLKGNEHYEYKISWLQDEKKEIGYTIDLKDTGKKDENGEEVLDVSYSVKGQMKKSEFNDGSMASLIDLHGLSLGLIIFNPMYQFIFSELELKEGEKTNFAGMGVVKVGGKEKIAGREGLLCQFFQKDDAGKEQLMVEWVIDPTLSLPLRTKTYAESELQSQCELTKFGN